MPFSPDLRISEADRAAYERDGVVCIRGAFSADWLDFLAGRVMDATRVNFFYDQLLVKEPGTSARTPWHQDQPYWAVSGRQVSSVWLTLDPVPEEVSVEYVCGSHRWPEHNPDHFADSSPFSRGIAWCSRP